MYPQRAVAAAPAAQFEPCGVEHSVVRDRMEPTTKNDWKRLAQLLKSARPQDYPEIDPPQFAEFRRDVIRYTSGRDLVPSLILVLVLALISILVIPAVLGPDNRVLAGIIMTAAAIAIPSIPSIEHRNLRSNLLGLGWSIGFFKLP